MHKAANIRSKHTLIFLTAAFSLGILSIGLPQPLRAYAVIPISGDGAIIGNDNVILGVDNAGHLNIPYREVSDLALPAIDPASVGFVGLRDGTGALASTEPGCLCEGWGIGTSDTGESGYANNAVGSADLVVETFGGTDGDDSATSTVLAFDTLRVTHEYRPSEDTPYLYEVIVTVENTGDADLNSVVYRRVMDWDVYPTPFSEFVTIQGTGTTTKLLKSGDNGFATSDPLASTGFELVAGTEDTDFVDSGPADHGSIFDFELGPLASDESTIIKTFYGAAPDEDAANSALATVGAELYSLGQSNSGGGADNEATTFIFAFGSVGGEPILNTPPTLDPISDLTVDEETLATFTATASDPDVGQTLTFSLSGEPPGASMDPSTGVFSWVPTEAQGPGEYTFDVIVSDGFETDTQTVKITVLEVGDGGGGGGGQEPTYDLDLFEGSDPSDGVVDLGAPVKASALTDDPEVTDVTFRWTSPSAAVEQTATVPVSGGSAEDTFGPAEQGTWTVEADFGNGIVIVKTLNITFFVLPEAPIGALAMIGSALAVLGAFAAMRRRNGIGSGM